jgi:hypothetical protein
MPSLGRIAAVVACTLALAGCATQYQIAEQSAKANRAVEDAQNEVLLLNVVRAYKERPMYLTAISKIAGPIGTATPAAALSLPFGPDAARAFNLTSSARADAPNFDVAVLDTHNFMRGFMQPIAPATVKYYLDQGAPMHFVLSLFIREIRGPDGRGVVNDPLVRAHYERFSADLKKLVYGCGLRIESQPQRIGPPLAPAAAESSLGTLIAMQKEGMELRRLSSGAFQLQKPNAVTVFTVDQACNMKLRVAGEDGKARSALNEHIIVLRSPEAVLHYLGEVARAELAGPNDDPGHPYAPEVWLSPNHAEPMFVLERGSPQEEGAVVRVEHEGETYYVPAGEAGGRSMHALSVVSQLIGLQKNAAELPTTTSVRVIGPINP